MADIKGVVENNENNIQYTFFVLDFDTTYDIENGECYGVVPVVYLIDSRVMEYVLSLAEKAAEEFANNIETDDCIGDIFEKMLTDSVIFWKRVGDIKLTVEERQHDYLTSEVEYTCV